MSFDRRTFWQGVAGNWPETDGAFAVLTLDALPSPGTWRRLADEGWPAWAEGDLAEVVTQGEGHPRLWLAQVSGSEFELPDDWVIVFRGDTGLSGEIDPVIDDFIRVLHRRKLARSDLASVPKAARWFLGTYGVYTPAALFHDWLTRNNEHLDTAPEIIGDGEADRYFRRILRAAGLDRFRSWIMWAAVAGRSRFRSRDPRARLGMLAWFVLGLVGMALFFTGLAGWADLEVAGRPVDPGWMPWDPVVRMAVASGLGVVAAVLWGRQWPAGLIAFPAGVVALPILTVTTLVDRLTSPPSRGRRDLASFVTRRAPDSADSPKANLERIRALVDAENEVLRTLVERGGDS